MENNQEVPVSPDLQPATGTVSAPEPMRPLSGAGGEKVLTPIDPNLGGSVINVPPAAAPAPTPPAGPVVWSDPTAPPPAPSQPALTGHDLSNWQSSGSSSLATPMFVLGASLLTLLVGIIFMTFGSSAPAGVIIPVMLIMSGVSVFIGLKAYTADNSNSLTLLGFIISTVVLVMSLAGSSTYLYYYFKYKALVTSLLV